MENYLKEVGARVKEARMRKRLSQAQLADLLGLTPPYISNIETGKQKHEYHGTGEDLRCAGGLG